MPSPNTSQPRHGNDIATKWAHLVVATTIWIVEVVTEIFDESIAIAYEPKQGDAVVMIHCGARALGHQIGTEFLRRMAESVPPYGLMLPDRELACAPIRSDLGQEYLGARRAAINCALANRQILTHLVRQVFAQLLPSAHLPLLYDVSYNTCKVETHAVDGKQQELYVHRKGATRAWGMGHPDLPADLSQAGQPVLIGGSMGTCSYVLAGTESSAKLAYSSASRAKGTWAQQLRTVCHCAKQGQLKPSLRIDNRFCRVATWPIRSAISVRRRNEDEHLTAPHGASDLQEP